MFFLKRITKCQTERTVVFPNTKHAIGFGVEGFLFLRRIEVTNRVLCQQIGGREAH